MSSEALAGGIEIHLLTPAWSEALAQFFTALRSASDAHRFHPHPLTDEEAEQLCRYVGKDLYYVVGQSGRVLGYGMLRGWDEGYDVPSLGIAIHPRERGNGLGRMLMLVLHQAAIHRGASRVRLKVYRTNSAALALYESLGYQFVAHDADQFIGTLDLR